MQRFCDEHPELAALFQALQDGMEGKALVSNSARPADMYAAGHAIALQARTGRVGPEVIAAGLRMVADAIDPPSVEARREIAETLGPSMLTLDEWEARFRARNRERDKLNQLGPQGVPPHTRG